MDEGIPIGAMIKVWWQRRLVLAVVVMTAVVVVGILGAGLYFGRPKAHQSVLTFRLLFKGVEQGTYPNGARFSPSDILSTAVLGQVFAQNDLSRFSKFDDFKNSMSVVVNNPALNQLKREYQDRLPARTLNSIERQNIEKEFAEKAAALKNAEFMLVISESSRLKQWPVTLASKVLTDTVRTWVEYSRTNGVFQFDINMLSENVLPVNSTDDDYLVFVDQLRLAIHRSQGNIDSLLRVPGADLLRVGSNNISLGELRVKLDDALKYRLSTIDSCIIQYGFYRNKELAEAYLREQMFRLQLTSDEFKAQVATLETVQTNYASARNGQNAANAAVAPSQGAALGSGPMITQLSDSFIDRVMQLSERSSDVAFRQNLANRVIEIENKSAAIVTERKYYERQLQALSDKPAMTANSDSTRQWLDKRLDGLLVEVKATMADMQVFYAELSRKELEPTSAYEVVGPVQFLNSSTLGVRKIILIVFALGLALVGTGLVVITWRGLHRLEKVAGSSNIVSPNLVALNNHAPVNDRSLKFQVAGEEH